MNQEEIKTKRAELLLVWEEAHDKENKALKDLMALREMCKHPHKLTSYVHSFFICPDCGWEDPEALKLFR